MRVGPAGRVLPQLCGLAQPERLNPHRESLLNALSFAESLKPSSAKPLAKSTIGVSSEEYEDIEVESPETAEPSESPETKSDILMPVILSKIAHFPVFL